MKEKKFLFLLSTLAVALLLSLSVTAMAKTPESILKTLAKNGFSESDLGDIDQQLIVPAAWTAGAKKEGKVTVLSTMDEDQWNVMRDMFEARYPFIKISYSRASHEDRANKTVEAFRAGRFVTDIITGIGGNFYMFKDAGALWDMSSIPQWQAIPPPFFKDADHGLWVGIHRRYWGWAYNTDLVKRKDLPNTYDEVLTNPLFRNGNLAIGNRPQLWLLALWTERGKDWTLNFMDKLFKVVKPQRRKEGMNAMVQFLGAGEWHINVPAGAYRVKGHAGTGSPVSWYSPEPLTVATSELAIMSNAQSPNAADCW